ncbi:MAG: NAD(P)-dependent oxidoreductase [Desulfurococcaceae archaeon]
MQIGVIGTGIMGSNVSRCLSRKKVKLGFYNRTISKAEMLANEVGGKVYKSPRELVEESDVVIVFLPSDDDVREIAIKISEKGNLKEPHVFVNASTVTPMASLDTMRILDSAGVRYIEGPVYGSADEARECKLISFIACDKTTYDEYKSIFELYSLKTYYVGTPPKASVLKLALNNLGLAFPALLAESLMLLESWGVELELFKEVSETLWFNEIINRYWRRAMEEKPPRFKTWMVGKDYSYVASALKAKKLPSFLSDALSAMYLMASVNGYGEKDYPRIIKYYLELARKTRS